MKVECKKVCFFCPCLIWFSRVCSKAYLKSPFIMCFLLFSLRICWDVSYLHVFFLIAVTAVLLQPPHPYLDCNLVTLFVFKGLISALVFKMLCFLPFKITARRELSHVRPHPPHLATSEQPMVRGNRDDVSPQSSHPRVSRNGSEHFRWALWSLFLFLSFLGDSEPSRKSSSQSRCCVQSMFT